MNNFYPLRDALRDLLVRLCSFDYCTSSQVKFPYIQRKKLLIVGMSANSDFQSKEEALNSGVDYFVTKPFAYKDLMPILCNASGPVQLLTTFSTGIIWYDLDVMLFIRKFCILRYRCYCYSRCTFKFIILKDDEKLVM